MEDLIELWSERNLGSIYSKDDLTSPYRYLMRLAERLDDLQCVVVYAGNRMAGFNIWENPTGQPDTANSLGCMVDVAVKGAPEFVRHEACKALHAQGIPYLNIGGSETPTLDAYKRKFRPARSYQLSSVRLMPKHSKSQEDANRGWAIGRSRNFVILRLNTSGGMLIWCPE